MSHRIAILVPYFGDWPPWINFFVESCRSNRTIDWFLFNDAEPPENRSQNVHHVRISFESYKTLVSNAIGHRITAQTPYKLCDIRPALGLVHADLLRGYDFFGFGDLDVIYGDIRSFYDDDVLAAHDILSSHPDRVSGHLCLLRNRDDVVTAFKKVRGWKTRMTQREHVGFDERDFFRLFRSSRAELLSRLGIRRFRGLFREAYSTPGPTGQMRWMWKAGRLTNEFYPHHPFMYLHFMSWHSNRWYAGVPGVTPDSAAPWSLLPNIVQMDWRDARTAGFMISPSGIERVEHARNG
jgi:hypothetical protein